MSTIYIGLVLAMVLGRRFGSGSGSEQNLCQTGGPGCQNTWNVNLGTVQWQSPNPSELGGFSASPSEDSYNDSVFAVW